MGDEGISNQQGEGKDQGDQFVHTKLSFRTTAFCGVV
jgi:hypothetical protein